MLDAIPDAESTVLKEPTQTISEQFAEAGDWANQKFTTGPGEYIEEPEFTYLTEGFKTAQDIMADLDDAPLEDPVGEWGMDGDEAMEAEFPDEGEDVEDPTDEGFKDSQEDMEETDPLLEEDGEGEELDPEDEDDSETGRVQSRSQTLSLAIPLAPGMMLQRPGPGQMLYTVILSQLML